MVETDASGPGRSTSRPGPIARLIVACAREPALTIVVIAALAVWGFYAAGHVSLDAIPDLSDPQVIVFTEWTGRSPDLVEDQITYPISARLLSAPRVRYVRGQSMFGMSFVYVVFEEGTDPYWARSRVVEYLAGAAHKLPPDVVPTLGPDATAVGWVFQYALVDRSGQNDLQQLRSLQDWNIRYALESVPGVAEVASIGGVVKRYEISIDPTRLQALGVSLREVVTAVRESNADSGGHSLELAGHEHVIRGRGYIESLADLESIPLRLSDDGTPVRLDDVAEIMIGRDTQRGLADLDGEGEVVGGIVVMRHDENALGVIDAVERRLEELRPGLPPGVEIVTTYDRSDLIRGSIRTLQRTLLQEMLVVSAVIFLALLHARSALIPIIILPLGALLAFIPMFYQGLTANIMSLGGIAVAIGAMVDASVIFIENIHKRLERWQADGRTGPRAQVLIDAMVEVGPTIFFSLLVMTVAFIPVFTLQGAEGRLFRPLAFTKTYSMGFAAILAVTLTPALAVLVIRGRIRGEDSNPINRWLIRAYTPVVGFVVGHPRAVIVAAVAAMALTVVPFLRLGSEFMPPLNEGSILYMPTGPPGISVTEAQHLLQLMDRELRSVPEVERVFGKFGRAETATDPAPLSMAETVILLAPRERWRPGLDWDGLIAELDEKVRYPGMPNVWWMPIQTRTEMLSTGIRSPVGVKVYGDNLAQIERAARAVERVLQAMPGTRSAFAERMTSGFFIDVRIDRDRAARYGLRARDINDVVLSAIGGLEVSETIEGRARYPVTIRYARDFRESPRALGRVLVDTPSGQQVPLDQVADIEFVNDVPMLTSENGRLVGFVFADPGNRAVVDYVAEARTRVSSEVEVEGTRFEWAGQYLYYVRALGRLQVVVPITLFLVSLLLYLSTRSLVETGIVLLAVPFSLIGAVWLLYLLDYNMSVAVWVGLIALAGLDAETGVVMLLYLKLAHRSRLDSGRLTSFGDLSEAIVEGAAMRIRPKIMTVLTTIVGLAPLLWATGPGADVMKRMAAPMVGGLVTSFLLELTVYPALFAIWKARKLEI